MKTLAERLEAEEQDEQLVKLKDKVRKLVKMSRSEMSKRYDRWDMQADVYRGIKQLDEEDLRAAEMNEPEKMIVPMSFAQVQTFVAFVFLLYTQKNTFYEFVATGAEDEDLTRDSEQLLERDLRNNQWLCILYQLLIDVARFGIAVTKHWWAEETQMVPVSAAPTAVSMFDGMTLLAGEQVETNGYEEVTKYEGNRVVAVSPYNFFPDTRFPLTQWKKGSFVADESEWHITQLLEWERQGIAHGVKHINPMAKEHFKKRGETRLASMQAYIESDKEMDRKDMVVCVTECQILIVPKDYGVGEEDFMMKYVVRVANDDRIISCEPLGYVHDDWTFDMGMFSPDMHQQLGDSLTDVIFALQDVVSYLINARLMSVRKGLENQLIVDPTAVDMTTVENRSPWIVMKKGSPRLGVDKFIRQLNYQDNTGSHFSDAQMLMSIMQVVTGVNENAMGQFHGGRRSATEAKAVNSGAAARMKVTAQVLWEQLFSPLGRKLHTNQRQGVSEETYRKVRGPEALARYSLFAPEDIRELVGLEDHFVFDGTLSSEKGFVAQSLQELAMTMMSNPEVMQILPLDLGKLLEEIFTLRGINNVSRFKLAPQPVQPPGRLIQAGTETSPAGTQPVPQLPLV